MDDEKKLSPSRRELWKRAAPLAVGGAVALATRISSLVAGDDPTETSREKDRDGVPPAASPGTPRLSAVALPHGAARVSPLTGTR
jgi:hypothetical protein